MACYFLSLNNSVSKKSLTYPLPSCFAAKIEVPLKKLRKRQELNLMKKLENSSAFVFSEPPLSHLIPKAEINEEDFFNSVILDALNLKIKELNIKVKRLVIFNPKPDMVLSALDSFDSLVLMGDNALSVANSLYPLTGASVPIVSGTDESDVVLSCFGSPDSPFLFLAGFGEKTNKNTLGGDGIFFYPRGQYLTLSNLAQRPLTLREAALLRKFDKKASFNIAF